MANKAKINKAYMHIKNAVKIFLSIKIQCPKLIPFLAVKIHERKRKPSFAAFIFHKKLKVQNGKRVILFFS